MARGRSLVGSQVSNWIGTAPFSRNSSGAATSKRIDTFTASGTWTCPTGVTYAIAHIRAGGGGGGGSTNSSAGGNSSALGTTATGGRAQSRAYSWSLNGNASPANSGVGGLPSVHTSGGGGTQGLPGGNGTYLVVGSTVTPGTNYTITVGAGGTAGDGGGAGGSGLVWIEYEV